MIEIGITLSSEERSPNALVEDAVAAEDAGFGFAMISDHFHPWIGRQGESPFVWSVLGAVFQATERLVVGTGVTCPIGRMHPAVVAQAAATTAELAPGRFVLGVGSGEALNEHITGDRWPSPPERRRRLEDAIKAIRALWSGDLLSFHGEGFDVIEARLYTLPAQPPPLLVAASGEESATLAGVLGDGMIGTSPEPAIIEAFDRAGGVGKPRFGQVTVCWAAHEPEARATAREWWPNAAVEGELTAELPLPRHFEQASAMVTEDAVADAVVCGPDPERYLERIRTYAEAGYSHIYLHQVGPDQSGFRAFYEKTLAPALSDDSLG